MDIKELKKQAQALKPVVVIGKQGLSEESVEQIKLHLNANKLTKIKLNTGFLDTNEESEKPQSKKDIATSIAEQLNAQVVQVVGNVIVFAKR